VSDDDIRSRNFQRPVYDFTLVVFGVEIDPAMGVFFHDLCQFPNQRQGFALIIFRLKRMVGPGCNGGSQQTCSQQQTDRYLFHRQTSKSSTNGLANDAEPHIAATQRRAVITVSSGDAHKSRRSVPCASSDDRQPTDESASTAGARSTASA